MHDLLSALILGIVEGVTEFLPISSTGHLLIAEHWLGARSEFFNVVIQAAAFVAVVLIYRRRLWELLSQWRAPANFDYLAKLSAAFAITAAGALAAKHFGFRLPEDVRPIAWAELIGGVFIFGIEWRVRRQRRDNAEISWGVALFVGAAQILAAVFPGTSRSLCTIFAAMLAGVSSRPAATEFSFLLGIPTMFAASGFELFEVVRHHGVGGEDWTAVALAFVVSGITAYVAVRWLLHYIRSHSFNGFGWYRLVLGVVLLTLVH
ncbi:MAG: undecaprenyl-diphosphate phosphatase [Gammaproteobacteria bacterium]|nr:undecaprenyl-diphosphate phosphatase [Gammaproteobacteria bacterium]